MILVSSIKVQFKTQTKQEIIFSFCTIIFLSSFFFLWSFLSVSGKFQDLVQITKVSDVLVKNSQHLGNVLETLDMQQHSIGYLAVLCAKFQVYVSSKDAPALDTFLPLHTQVQEFIYNCNGEQVRFAPEQCKYNCNFYIQTNFVLFLFFILVFVSKNNKLKCRFYNTIFSVFLFLFIFILFSFFYFWFCLLLFLFWINWIFNFYFRCRALSHVNRDTDKITMSNPRNWTVISRDSQDPVVRKPADIDPRRPVSAVPAVQVSETSTRVPRHRHHRHQSWNWSEILFIVLLLRWHDLHRAQKLRTCILLFWSLYHNPSFVC